MALLLFFGNQAEIKQIQHYTSTQEAHLPFQDSVEGCKQIILYAKPSMFLVSLTMMWKK